jgi:hypothetical protein
MAVKISQMPELNNATGEEILPAVDEGINVKISVNTLKKFGTSLFITDVVKTNVNDTAGVTPNRINIIGSVYVVDSVQTQNTNVRVYVEWEGSYDQYMGTITVNGVAISNSNITIPSANIRKFRGYADVVLQDQSGPDYPLQITVEHSSGNTISVPVTFETVPEIINVEPILPVDITELPPNRSFNINITASKPFTTVKLRYNGANEVTISSVSTPSGGNYISTVSGILTSAFDNARGTLTVTASTGDSNGFSAFANPLNNTLTYNGYKPVISAPTYFYPNTQQAIKNTETATVEWSLAGSNSSLLTGFTASLMTATSSTLTIVNVAYDNVNRIVSAEVSRGTASLSVGLNNLQLVAQSSVNRYSSNTANAQVAVAHTAVALTNNGTPATIKGGSINNIESIFNQPVIVTAMSVSANRGTLTPASLPITAVSNITRNVSVSQTDIFSLTDTNNLVIEVTSLSGVTYTLNRNYRINGFAAVQVTFTAPQNTALLPFPITNNANVIITNAVINSIPPLQLTMNQVATPAQMVGVEDYALINSPGATPSMVINEAVLRDFYYTNGVTLTLNIGE